MLLVTDFFKDKFWKVKNKIISVRYNMCIDSIYQHSIPFVIVITIMFLSVPHDYILLGHTTKLFFSVSITSQENMILIEKKNISKKIFQGFKYIASTCFCLITLMHYIWKSFQSIFRCYDNLRFIHE